MNGENEEPVKPKSLSAKIKALASSRRIQSSGYGKVHDQPKMFQPRLNKKRNNSNGVKPPSKAWESHDEGFISPTSSLEDLSSESSEHKPRGKWKQPKVYLVLNHSVEISGFFCHPEFT